VQVIRTRTELDGLDALRADGALALVPTMGALHEGHLQLVRRARTFGPTVVSIFVNPTQFGPGEDYDAYPRDLDSDLALLEPLGVDAVFAPTPDEMYRGGGVRVAPGPRSKVLCGASRPGHFGGVLTVVAKLFNLLRPEIAVFGRKDAQQCLVIDEMVTTLDFAVRLIDHPTVREADGLAMSSRNRYLAADDRRRAGSLWRALTAARGLLEQGERDPARLRRAMARELAETDGVEYAEIRSVPELTSPARATGRLLLAIAAQVGPARLIDNLVLGVDADIVAETALFADGGTP
jgi:pantoate--beta-alanine ligase